MIRILFSQVIVYVVLGIAIVLIIDFIVTERQIQENIMPNIKTQIQNLEEIEKSLSNLRRFVNIQKKNLIENEERILALKTEHKTIKPLVDTDRKIIEAIFAVQEERRKTSKWMERLLGVFFGIFSSLMATVIYRMVTARRQHLL